VENRATKLPTPPAKASTTALDAAMLVDSPSLRQADNKIKDMTYWSCGKQ
jgi:hypothetical protein